MLAGILTAFGICTVLFVVFLFVFSKQLRAMRERDDSIFNKLFKRK